MLDLTPLYSTIEAKMDPDRVRETVASYVAGWRTGNRDMWLNLFADDAVFEDPAGSRPMAGKDAIAAFFDATNESANKLDPVIDRIVVCGKEAILLFTMNVYHPDGSGTALKVVDCFKLGDDGKISKLRAFWDPSCASEAPPSRS